MAKEVLLVLGAGRANLPILQTAKTLGYRCYVVSKEAGSYPGVEYADHLILADMLNPQQILSALGLNPGISAVLSCCSDMPLYSQAVLCEKLGLPGISKFTASCSQNKKLLKQALSKNGCKQAEYWVCEDLEQVERIVNRNDEPVIVKPIAGQGSSGVKLLSSSRDLTQLSESGYFASEQEWIVEEYLPEPFEFGAQAFVDRGKLLFLEFHNDFLLSIERPIPVEHRFPFEAPVEKLASGADFLESASVECEKAIRALQIENGAVNLDLIYSRGEIYLLELTNRAGANGLIPAISRRFGLDYPQLIIENALGRDISSLWSARSSDCPYVISRMIFPPEYSVVEKFSVTLPAATDWQSKSGATPDTIRPEQLEIDSFLTAPRQIERISSSNDCVGQLVLSAPTENVLNCYLDMLLSGISFC